MRTGSRRTVATTVHVTAMGLASDPVPPGSSAEERELWEIQESGRRSGPMT
jgi:hypothetical protein